MRIGTWNLQRGGSRAVLAGQEAALRALDLDVVVLTEPPPSYTPAPNVVMAPASPGRPTWIAVRGEAVEPLTDFFIPCSRLAAAARVVTGERSVIVYGTVLPWLSVASHAPEIAGFDGSFATFRRVLSEQAADLRVLQHRSEPVLWVGDFNQNLVGPLIGGSTARRQALLEVLDDLDLLAWNADAAHAEHGLMAIDLLCGPRSTMVERQGRIDPIRQGVRLSDHAGYWVEI